MYVIYVIIYLPQAALSWDSYAIEEGVQCATC